jgi:hypothetical protein
MLPPTALACRITFGPVPQQKEEGQTEGPLGLEAVLPQVSSKAVRAGSTQSKASLKKPNKERRGLQVTPQISSSCLAEHINMCVCV